MSQNIEEESFFEVEDYIDQNLISLAQHKQYSALFEAVSLSAHGDNTLANKIVEEVFRQVEIRKSSGMFYFCVFFFICLEILLI